MLVDEVEQQYQLISYHCQTLIEIFQLHLYQVRNETLMITIKNQPFKVSQK
jgi:hypothetical protein